MLDIKLKLKQNKNKNKLIKILKYDWMSFI